jgi:Tfp pilus assembly protein FimT
MNKLKAFSTMELLVVLAITGLLVSFFYTSMNNFQRYLQSKSDSASQTSRFMVFKSNLRQEFFLADSIQLFSNQLRIFLENDSVCYSPNSENQIIRKTKNQEKLFDAVHFESIESYQIQDVSFVRFTFEYNGQVMEMVTPKYPAISQEVNAFFKSNHVRD